MSRVNGDPTKTKGGEAGLDVLVNREEMLEICFWFRGEGFGEVFTATLLEPFVNQPRDVIETALVDLAGRELLEPVAEAAGAFRFTAKGRAEAGRLFAEDFSDYQRGGHGECPAGCCDGDDHSRCGHDCPEH